MFSAPDGTAAVGLNWDGAVDPTLTVVRLDGEDGYHVLLFVTETEDADELLVELLRYQVDGIVMASTHLSSGLAQQIVADRQRSALFCRDLHQPACHVHGVAGGGDVLVRARQLVLVARRCMSFLRQRPVSRP